MSLVDMYNIIDRIEGEIGNEGKVYVSINDGFLLFRVVFWNLGLSTSYVVSLQELMDPDFDEYHLKKIVATGRDGITKLGGEH